MLFFNIKKFQVFMCNRAVSHRNAIVLALRTTVRRLLSKDGTRKACYILLSYYIMKIVIIV